MKSFHVELKVLTTHVFKVDANSEEEAIGVAEVDLFNEESDDIGEVTNVEVIESDAFETEPEVVN